MNDQAAIGHNGPPDAIDDICAAYEADRQEAENWLDGSPVESEDQMQSVDALRQSMRKFRLDLERGQKDATAPLHEAYKAELNRWKPTISDAKSVEGALVATVNDFKQKQAAQKEAARRAAWEAAEQARREAEAAAAKANPANIDEAREAEAAAIEAQKAQIAAQAAQKDTVKGLRTFRVVEVQDYAACINWIRIHDREALVTFCDEYARINHAARIGGVDVRKEKRAY